MAMRLMTGMDVAEHLIAERDSLSDKCSELDRENKYLKEQLGLERRWSEDYMRQIDLLREKIEALGGQWYSCV